MVSSLITDIFVNKDKENSTNLLKVQNESSCENNVVLKPFNGDADYQISANANYLINPLEEYNFDVNNIFATDIVIKTCPDEPSERSPSFDNQSIIYPNQDISFNDNIGNYFYWFLNFHKIEQK